MLQSSTREYKAQQRLVALAVIEADRLGQRGPRVIAELIRTYQAAAVSVALSATEPTLVEQGIVTARVATVVTPGLLTPTTDLIAFLNKTTNPGVLVQTFMVDASRTARQVDMATRPAVTGYIRSLMPPSCIRCAVLAGRVYSKSHGFQRHPRCDCLMTPSDMTIGPTLVTDPKQAFKDGQIKGLSVADTKALEMGANMGQVANLGLKSSGLTVGSSVIKRGGKLTPAGCFARSQGSNDMALGYLRKYGYIA